MSQDARFFLRSSFSPAHDQIKAIRSLSEGIARGDRSQVLLGITGSGKTFTVANVIERIQCPTLVLAHNKTLAAQLYGELRDLFPMNAVEYFVSYYDYYQPEAYVPGSDVYIEKDATINDDIDRMRHAATRSLLSRRDVIIVASVSCIYGIGSSDFYGEMAVELAVGQQLQRDDLLQRLVEIRYARSDLELRRSSFRVRGEVVDILASHEETHAIRIEFFGDEIESIIEIDPLRGTPTRKRKDVKIFPSSHYVTPVEQRRRALILIREELGQRLQELRCGGRLLEAQRLEERTLFDLEMLEETGFCNGIENYSRHFSERKEGDPPTTLLDYFPSDYLLIVDESHQMVPQLGAMYRGDRSRKNTLVEFGFRLPSALDNRPLRFDEFLARVNQVIFVSATPGDWELQASGGEIVEQIIRPTGLLDPEVHVRSASGQVDDLLGAIRSRIESGQRVLVTTLTKKMAEDLTEYYRDLGIRVRYLHSDIDTLQRVELIGDLRRGAFDVLVGINLLREGLDIPEVSLVAILDADKEGFLRSERSLIQTIGRASRNASGTVIMYADKITSAMQVALDETARRRRLQEEFNRENNLRPRTVKRQVLDLGPEIQKGRTAGSKSGRGERETTDSPHSAAGLRERMKLAAEALDFEEAARLRDQLWSLENVARPASPRKRRR